MQNLNFSSYSNLNTNRLALSFPKIDDAQGLYKLRSNEVINEYISRKIPKNNSDVIAFIEVISEGIKENKNLYWIIKLIESNEIIGTIGLQKFSTDFKYAEIGYELHPNFQKKGYMTEALQKVITFGFEELHLKTIEAFTHKNNEASKALLLKNKFIYQPNRIDEGFENNSIFQLKSS